MPAIPKPESRKTAKGRRDRREAAVKRAVRAACLERDLGCRLSGYGPCDGPLAWCHMEGKRRHQTRGLPPEERHSTAWTLMLCARHSEMEERHQVRMCYLSERGADGRVAWRREE